MAALEGRFGSFCHYRDMGKISFLTSYANHAYGPLLMYDQTIERIATGASDIRILSWRAANWYLGSRVCLCTTEGGIGDYLEQKQVLRKGIDRILESNGIDCFFVESHLVEQGKSEGVQNTFTKLS